jgi:hypothetical protein
MSFSERDDFNERNEAIASFPVSVVTLPLVSDRPMTGTPNGDLSV